jgi:predicted DNA-binding protein
MVGGKLLRVKKTTLYLPAEIELRLRDAARRSRRPQAELIREALDRYLAEDEPWPQSIGAGEDGEVGGANSEDWLRANWGRR